MRTAVSLSLNFPRWRTSSKSSPPLQILYVLRLIYMPEKELHIDLLGNKVVTFIILEELVHLDDVGMILDSQALKAG